MISILRKNQRVLMILVTIVVIISFAWLYNSTDLDRIGTGNVATAYGRQISQLELNKKARLFDLSASLGLYDVLMGLGGGAPDRNQMLETYVWNSLVLSHEAEALQVEPDPAEIAATLRGLPVFQTEGDFDLKRYNDLIERNLAPNGLTEADLEEAVRGQLRYLRVRALVESSATVPPDEVRTEWDRLHRQIHLHVIRFALDDFSAGVVPTDDEVRQYYEANKDKLLTPEMRAVSYVKLDLPAGVKEAQGKDRIQALQEIADKAGDFAQAMLDPGAKFHDVAARFGLDAKATGEFTADAPAPDFADAPDAVDGAFQLTTNDPNSDVIQTGDSFYLLHLDKLVEPRGKSLEEAKDGVIAALREQKGRGMMDAKVAAVRGALAGSTSSVAALADAAKAQGVSVETLPAFSLAEPNREIKDLGALIQPALELVPQRLSNPVRTPGGAALVYLEKWTAADEAKFTAGADAMKRQIFEGRQQIAFYEWLSSRRKAANVQPLQKS